MQNIIDVKIRDLGDLLDRASISELKSKRIGSDESHREYLSFMEAISKVKEEHPEFEWEQGTKMMLMLNSSIWFLESELRSGKDCLPNSNYLDDDINIKKLSEIGKNAILIRNINALRVQFKNFINSSLKQGFLDSKKDHVSEGI